MNLPKCFELRVTLNANTVGVPQDVLHEIGNELWPNEECGDNETIFFNMKDGIGDMSEEYPAIATWLKSLGVTEGCYINYGW